MKVEHIQAFRIALSDGVDAVFVQVGKPWNGMLELTCVAPGAFKGDKLIVAPEESRLMHGFSELFGTPIVANIVMASPSLSATLKAIAESEKA